MAQNSQIPVPAGGSFAALIAWSQSNPTAIADLVSFINKLRGARVRLVAPSGPASAGTPLGEAGANLQILIPLQFASNIGQTPTYAGGNASSTYSASEVSALKAQVASLTSAVNALIAALSQTGQNPA